MKRLGTTIEYEEIEWWDGHRWWRTAVPKQEPSPTAIRKKKKSNG